MASEEQVSQIIDKVAEKLGLAAEQAAAVAERLIGEYQAQAIVGLVACAIAGIIAGIAAAVCIRAFIHQVKTDNGMTNDEITGPCAVYGLFSIVGLFLATAFLGSAVGNLRRVVAPAYYMLKELIG